MPVVTDAGPAGATATFSACRRYRYLLTRVVGDKPGAVLFVMLNPSTADAFKLDPTVRRCVGFARAWDVGTLMVANVGALRATRPRDMLADTYPVEEHDAPGRNDATIVAAARVATMVVCAWGKHAASARFNRSDYMRALLSREVMPSTRLWHLGLNGDGTPKHPLYRPADTAPADWRLSW